MLFGSKLLLGNKFGTKSTAPSNSFGSKMRTVSKILENGADIIDHSQKIKNELERFNAH